MNTRPDSAPKEHYAASLSGRHSIFSDDAVGLESKLHQEFSERRVNQVNLRREFFYATPAEVREVLERIAGNHLLEYNETPEALEYRAGKPAWRDV